MPANFKAELLACIGQPVAENPTGPMQEAAFRALGLDWRYLTVEVAPENLADAIRGVRAFGLRGINLTIPHKVAVMQYLDEIAAGCRDDRRGQHGAARWRAADRREYRRQWDSSAGCVPTPAWTRRASAPSCWGRAAPRAPSSPNWRLREFRIFWS